jgi:ribonuclease HII
MDLRTEKNLWKQGYKLIVGIDEVGRGPLAGPVVAAAVIIFAPKINQSLFLLVNDSKKLTAKQREFAFNELQKENQIVFGIGKISEKIIDKINIFNATKRAMEKAVRSLAKKIGKTPDFLIIDGKHKINSEIEQKPIIKADEKIFSCSAASIVAKVTRDRLMDRMHKKYPQYGFDKHKGYGTQQHYQMLKKHGACPIHRQSFYLGVD